MGRMIGVYGGSFNPPHRGHVLAAAEMIRLLALDRLLIVPTYLSPHKPQPAGSPDPAQRLALVRQAFAPVAGAEVSTLEILRGGVSYTVDTLRTLTAQYPGDELLLMMGTDMLLSFPSWRAPAEIARMATLCVVHRQDESETLRAQLRETAARIETELGARVRFVENDSITLSSTEVRRMIALGLPEYGLAPDVAETIRRERLYRCGSDWKNLPFEQLQEISISLHDEQRKAHVLGCCETAEAMARRWGEDPGAARRAGILHDVTKALCPQAQLALCECYGQPLTLFERAHPKLLHAKSGAAAARAVFGESEAVCNAIEWHTTGKPDMCPLEKILYLADCIEPTRDYPGVERLRALAFEDLDAAMLLGLRMSLDVLARRGWAADPNTEAAWNYLLERSNTAWTN